MSEYDSTKFALPHFVAAIPLNKQLYTLSYICVTAGAAGIVFSMLYFLVSPSQFYKTRFIS